MAAGGLETLAMIADRGQSERARTSAIKVIVHGSTCPRLNLLKQDHEFYTGLVNLT